MARILKPVSILSAALVAAVVAHYSVSQYPGGFAFGPSGSLAMYFWLASHSSKIGWLSLSAAFTITCFVIAVVLSLALLIESKQALRASTVLFLLLAISNALHFVGDWEQGVSLHGIAYVLKALVVNIAFATACGVLLLKARQYSNEGVPLYQAHGLLLIWLAWVSLPYFGMITYG